MCLSMGNPDVPPLEPPVRPCLPKPQLPVGCEYTASRLEQTSPATGLVVVGAGGVEHMPNTVCLDDGAHFTHMDYAYCVSLGLRMQPTASGASVDGTPLTTYLLTDPLHIILCKGTQHEVSVVAHTVHVIRQVNPWFTLLIGNDLRVPLGMSPEPALGVCYLDSGHAHQHTIPIHSIQRRHPAHGPVLPSPVITFVGAHLTRARTAVARTWSPSRVLPASRQLPRCAVVLPPSLTGPHPGACPTAAAAATVHTGGEGDVEIVSEGGEEGYMSCDEEWPEGEGSVAGECGVPCRAVPVSAVASVSVSPCLGYGSRACCEVVVSCVLGEGVSVPPHATQVVEPHHHPPLPPPRNSTDAWGEGGTVPPYTAATRHAGPDSQLHLAGLGQQPPTGLGGSVRAAQAVGGSQSHATGLGACTGAPAKLGSSLRTGVEGAMHRMASYGPLTDDVCMGVRLGDGGALGTCGHHPRAPARHRMASQAPYWPVRGV